MPAPSPVWTQAVRVTEAEEKPPDGRAGCMHMLQEVDLSLPATQPHRLYLFCTWETDYTFIAYPHSWGAKDADKWNPLWSTWHCSEMETIRREGSSKLSGQHHPASPHLCFTSPSLGWTNLITILEFAGSGLSGRITGKLRLSATGIRWILLALSALIDAQVWWRGASPPGELIEPCCADCGIAATERAKTTYGVSGRWY